MRVLIIMAAVAILAGTETRQNYGAELFRNLKKEPRRNSKSLFIRNDVVADLFRVYDPTFLSHFWPKLRNEVHMSLNNECWEDLRVFYKDLLDGRAWAMIAVDASGRYKSGLFEGNRFWLGSKTECNRLDQNYLNGKSNETDEFINTEYLRTSRRDGYYFGLEQEWHSQKAQEEMLQQILAADKIPKFRVSQNIINVQVNITNSVLMKTQDIILGLCLPRTCDAEDIQAIINFTVLMNDHMRINKSFARSVKILNVKQLKEYSLSEDTGTILLIVISAIIVAVVFTATLVDLKLLKTSKTKTMNLKMERPDMIPINTHKMYKTVDTKTHTLPRKHMNADAESLTINNMHNANKINLVTVKKILKADSKPPSITLDVVAMDDAHRTSCHRCGKYRKQCVNPRIGPSCPSMKSAIKVEAVSFNKDSFLRSVLVCFSVKNSLRKIFNENMANRDLGAVHGLKIVATLWMIYVHVALITGYVAENSQDKTTWSLVNNIFATGTFAFDTLFFISGLLSAHHFFYLKSQYTTKELVSFGGAFGQILQIFCFITNRAIRLLPSYIYVMFLGASIARGGIMTSALELPEQDHEACSRHWWRNLLYINTFFDTKERCMQWSWYLSLETQLHALGVLAVCICRKTRSALALVTLFLLGMFITDTVLVYSGYGESAHDSYTMYSSLVERSWARATPYFIGILIGWLLNKLSGRLSIGKVSSSCLWFSSLVLPPALLLKPWAAHCLGPVGSSLAFAGAHAVWALAMAWPAVAMATKCPKWSRKIFGNSAVAALSRLSYGMLLVHGAVARSLVLGADSAFVVTPTILMSFFAGTVVVSAVGALLLSVFIETPCCSLLRRLTDCAS